MGHSAGTTLTAPPTASFMPLEASPVQQPMQRPAKVQQAPQSQEVQQVPMMQQSPPAWMQEQTRPQVMSPLGRSTSFQYEEGIGPPFKLASLETDSRECKNSTSSLIGHQQQQEYKPPWVQEQPWDEQAARREQILQQQQQQQQQQRALAVSLALHYHRRWQLLTPHPPP